MGCSRKVWGGEGIVEKWSRQKGMIRKRDEENRKDLDVPKELHLDTKCGRHGCHHSIRGTLGSSGNLVSHQVWV